MTDLHTLERSKGHKELNFMSERKILDFISQIKMWMRTKEYFFHTISTAGLKYHSINNLIIRGWQTIFGKGTSVDINDTEACNPEVPEEEKCIVREVGRLPQQTLQDLNDEQFRRGVKSTGLANLQN